MVARVHGPCPDSWPYSQAPRGASVSKIAASMQ
jgi:hypothetical protein